MKSKISRNDLRPGESLCDHCTAKCCKYFAIQIETPESHEDYQFIRWYLFHDLTSVFVDEGKWYVLVHTACEHLREDNRCGIYDRRPAICRDYTTDNCEYDDSWTYEKYFETAEQIEEYAEAVLQPKDKTSIRSPRPNPLPIIA